MTKYPLVSHSTLAFTRFLAPCSYSIVKESSFLRRSATVDGQFLVVAGNYAEPEIDQFDVAFVIDQEIFQFDISMNLSRIKCSI
jgi:hypothetical protein